MGFLLCMSAETVLVVPKGSANSACKADRKNVLPNESIIFRTTEPCVRCSE